MAVKARSRRVRKSRRKSPPKSESSPNQAELTVSSEPEPEPIKLTAKEEAFVREFLIDLNATQAAKRAGYSPKTARQIASENLSKPYIQRAVRSALNSRAERVKVDADWVLKRLKVNVNRSLQVVPVLDSEGKRTGIFRYEGQVVNQGLKLIGEHIGMFDDHRDPDDPSRKKMPTVYIIGGQRVEF